jgi:glycosyltransferase involved in cell wall biosynthesis
LAEPLVSVIVPVYNGERFLAAAVESALEQDYPSVEVIVVDDGSTDRSGAIAQSHPVRYLRQERGGAAAARNLGIGASRGDLVALLNADDLWTPDKLTRQVGHLLDNPRLGFVLGLAQMFVEPGIEQPRWLKREWLDPVPGVTGTLVAWRRTFDTVGPLDETYKADDAEWIRRAMDLGIPWGLVDAVVLRYRIHDTNHTHDLGLVRTEVFRVLRESLERRRGRAAASGG